MNSFGLIMIILVSDLAAGLIGWLLGRTARHVDRLVAEVDAVADEPGVSPETRGKLHRIVRGIRPMHLAMVLLLVVGAVTTLVGFVGMAEARAAQQRVDDAIECLSDFSNASADALEARAQASAEAQEEVDTIFSTVALLVSQPDEQAGQSFRDAILGYTQARRDQRVALQRNPFPDPPRDACRNLG